MIKGIIFDFDGLILETEMSSYQSWKLVYQENGLELPMELWLSFVGGSGDSDYDPLEHLHSQLGAVFDPEVTELKQHKRFMKMLANQPPMPGVVQILKDAKHLDLKLAIASSSDAKWVNTHLNNLNLRGYFNAVITSEMVKQTKPDPALFLLALDKIGILAEEAIVLEDSLNGVRGAQRAGIFVVAVPNEITLQTPVVREADLVLNSLADMSLEELLATVEKRKQG
jgi:HAD superfamily hydrolase (TIGR01509 family)